ncbi:hypothetical protein [Pseudomonas protegens]|uniref:hypothetical protein n=1 Tax=Pseudomonas protegens TaxID=380021 RepID=UPI0015E76F7E|nr:hypothetical protein [Pseudomonas protegens]
MTDWQWILLVLIGAAAGGQIGYIIGLTQTFNRLFPELHQAREELAKLRKLLKFHGVRS